MLAQCSGASVTVGVGLSLFMGRTPNRLEVPQRVTTWIAQAIDHRAHKLQGNEKTTGMDQLGARDLAKLKPEPLAPKN